MSEEEDANLPSAAECDMRSHEFAILTKTDTALAMYYLQDRNWDLQSALNAYFENNPGVAATGGNSVQSSDSMSSVTKPKRIRILSWNIDGLDDNNIQREKPDVVFLQEVVPANYDVIVDGLPAYHAVPAGDSGYFIVALLHTESVEYTDHAITPFHSSKMARNLLQIKAKVRGLDMLLMTSHLESTKDHAGERKRQLQAAFKDLASSGCTAVFAGDLNLRDAELTAVGGLPDGVLDLWEVTGKRPEAKFTWDLRRNDNKEMPGRFQPQSRFDRMYLKTGTNPTLQPRYFELVGIERLKTCRRFASDHWGILGHFDITDSTQ